MLTVDDIREYCLAKPGVSEDFPFGEDTLVFRVSRKIFALLSLESSPLSINLKCEPQKAIDLREAYPAIAPGFHMNKKHWNTVTIDHSINSSLLKEMIDHSYKRVADGLSKNEKQELGR